MPRTSPFSADDHLDPDANRPIGELDASYRAARSRGAKPAKHVPVRDASGSFTNEEAVQAYMMPSKYLTPKVNERMAPKRPLGARAAKKQPDAVPMYSQVATFGSMERVRRPRMTIPVEEADGEGWSAWVRRRAALIISLIVAGALFVADKAKALGHLIAQQAHRLWMAAPLVHARTSYSAYRGTRVSRLGMKDSRFKVITPVILVLFVTGLAVFSSLVGENPFAPGKGGSNSHGNSPQQGSAVLNITPGKGGGAPSGGATAGSGGGNPQAAQQAAQAANGSASAVQSSPSSALGSGGALPVGGYGGGSSGSAPAGGGGGGGGGSSAPAAIVPSVPSTGSVSAPATSGGSGGSGSGSSGSSGGGSCLCSTLQPVTNTVQGTTQPVTNTVQGVTNQAPSTVNNATAPVTNTTSGLGL